MGEYVWFHDVSWHASYAIYFFVIGILAGLSFMSYGSWITPALRPLRKRRPTDRYCCWPWAACC
jgi:hypothetical protein